MFENNTFNIKDFKIEYNLLLTDKQINILKIFCDPRYLRSRLLTADGHSKEMRSLYGIIAIIEKVGNTSRYLLDGTYLKGHIIRKYLNFFVNESNMEATTNAILNKHFIKDFDIQNLNILKLIYGRTIELRALAEHTTFYPRFTAKEIMRKIGQNDTAKNKKIVEARLNNLEGILALALEKTEIFGRDPESYINDPKYYTVFFKRWFLPTSKFGLVENILKYHNLDPFEDIK